MLEKLWNGFEKFGDLLAKITLWVIIAFFGGCGLFMIYWVVIDTLGKIF